MDFKANLLELVFGGHGPKLMIHRVLDSILKICSKKAFKMRGSEPIIYRVCGMICAFHGVICDAEHTRES